MRSSRMREKQQLSQREKLQMQGEGLINERKQAIDQLNQQIEETETELARYRRMAAMKYQELEEMRVKEEKENNEEEEDKEDDETKNEINELIEANEKEIEEVSQSYKDEIEELKNEYKEKLEEAENWADQHIEVVVREKEIELRDIEQELEYAKNDRNTMTLSQTKTQANAQEQIDKTSHQNENRVKYLQEEINKVAASTREEVRDVKNKINETISTIEITEIEHQNALMKYEKEIKEREKVYEECMKALNSRYAAEKKHIEKSMAIAVAQAQSAVSVKKRLEKFHEKQINTSRMDTERLKSTLMESKSRDSNSLKLTATITAKIQEISRQCDEVERDDQIVLDEVKELEEENDELRAELERVTKLLYNQNE